MLKTTRKGVILKLRSYYYKKAIFLHHHYVTLKPEKKKTSGINIKTYKLILECPHDQSRHEEIKNWKFTPSVKYILIPMNNYAICLRERNSILRL